eukprot:g1681.t1
MACFEVSLLFLCASSMAQVPATMRAIQVSKAAPEGDWSHVALNSQAPVPKPSASQVLIKVSASSVNPVDWKIVESGQGSLSFLMHFPHTLGFDVAGTVAAVGKSCKRLKVGDKVWADLGKTWPLRGGELGAYAEYAVADEAQVGIKPPSITDGEAAALPLVALTSYQALVKTGAPHIAPWGAANQNLTVMVTSGSGGTGHVAIQMAKAFGAAHVITVTNSANVAFVKALGADVVYDYTKGDAFAQLPADSVDVVYDNFGAPGTADKAMNALRSDGVFIYLPGKGGGVSKKPKKGVKQINYGLCDSSKHEDLDALSAMIAAGQLRGHVQQSFELANVVQAFNTSFAGQVVGKLGIHVSGTTASTLV